METDDVSVREQLFHNRVRETIVSNAGLNATVGWRACMSAGVASVWRDKRPPWSAREKKGHVV